MNRCCVLVHLQALLCVACVSTNFAIGVVQELAGVYFSRKQRSMWCHNFRCNVSRWRECCCVVLCSQSANAANVGVLISKPFICQQILWLVVKLCPKILIQIQLSHVLQIFLHLHASAVVLVVSQVVIGEFESPEQSGDDLCVVFRISCNVLPKFEPCNA